MLYSIKLKQLDKYNMTVNLGDSGSIILNIRWNETANKWVMGMSTTNGTQLFCGQSLIQSVDLLACWRNLIPLRGSLYLVDSIRSSTKRSMDYDNITEFSLNYLE